MRLHIGCGVDILPGYINIDDLSDWGWSLDRLQQAVYNEGLKIDLRKRAELGHFIVARAEDIIGKMNEYGGMVEEIRCQRFLGRGYFEGWGEPIFKVLSKNGVLRIDAAHWSVVASDIEWLVSHFSSVHIETLGVYEEDHEMDVSITCRK